MENKINIAKLLKDCPEGMELDCTMYDNVTFDCVLINGKYPISVKTPVGSMTLTEYGQCFDNNLSKCVIFPKGKTTWEGFQRPFKDGDIIYNRPQKKICIYYLSEDGVPRIKGCIYNEFNLQLQFEKLEYPIPIAIQDYRLATEEEKQKLFDAIKANGYKWNAITKTLEKLVEPKFKVGDKIRQICSPSSYIIKTIEFDRYILNNNQFLKFKDEHIYELVPNKFDITTLKPFDKVLVRDGEGLWRPTLFGKDMIVGYRYYTANGGYKKCIPYEGNEHLLGTYNDCDEYYKTWE